ncbi:hypothetical protein KFE98_02035 [bacterium SCSIO 12741]|nr:hypothetical protein KFE98_02035 [bacterium SCSIO 12741]
MLGLALEGQAQDAIRKGRVFFYWGYNRSWYTKSDIHLQGKNYDVTIHDAKGQDKPEPVDLSVYCHPERFTVPQYNYALGYHLSEKWSIAGGFDHMKYFFVADQSYKITGYAQTEEHPEVNGEYQEDLVFIPSEDFEYEHSDGLNYVFLEGTYHQSVWMSPSQRFYLDVNGGLGAGLLIPKTRFRAFDHESDNRFHVAGGGFNGKLEMRFTFYRNFFLQTAAKGGYLWMGNILTTSDPAEKADQRFGFLEYFVSLGFSVPLNKQ